MVKAVAAMALAPGGQQGRMADPQATASGATRDELSLAKGNHQAGAA